MRTVYRNATLLTLVALLAGLLAAAPTAAEDPATQIRELTGAETRVVWIRHKQWESYNGSLDGGAGFSIMAFDTGPPSLESFGVARGKGERELVPEGEIFNPLISPSGRQVIYSAKTDGNLRMHCVNWDGANSRVLGDGFAQWPWRDPATGIEWVYTSDSGGGSFVDRFQLDKPEIRERIYEGRLANRFSLSADGTRAVGEFPWPAAGMLYIRTGQVDHKDYRPGCNTYIAPDNSYLVTIMAGSHDLVTLYKPDGSSRDVSVVPPGLKKKKDGGNGCMWNPKWATDARHMVTAGPFRNLGPDRADIWLGQFADDFNSIAKWVQVTDNDFMDVYAYVWVDPGVGQYAGEAPYTLGVPSLVTGPGNWQWTFGDGSRGTEGKHTYSKAGAYAITATQGNRTLKGMVRVAERASPKLLSAVALDDRRVLLTCSEPVQAANAKVTLQSGTAATKLYLDNEGSGIIAEFAAPLGAKETLTVTGVTDSAQAPNEMAPAKVPLARPDWPSNQAGLVGLWKNARSRNRFFSEQFGLVTAGIMEGNKQFDRFGAAVLEGYEQQHYPAYLSADTHKCLTQGVQKTHQFSLEIVVSSADLAQTKDAEGAQAPLPIFNWGGGYFGRDGESINFLLSQEKNLLQVALANVGGGRDAGVPAVFDMATLPDTQPHHVIVSCADKRLVCYLDGKKVKEIDPSPAKLGELDSKLFFGGYDANRAHGKSSWRGKFEHLALYNRFIEEPEAAKNAAAVAADLAQRKALPRIEVEATLIAKSKVPDPKQMAPYRHALIVNEYSVEKVLKGKYEQKTIRVAQWGMRDLKPTPLAALKPGTSVKLVLETFADHDELVPELISDTLKEDFDMKLYTDVNL